MDDHLTVAETCRQFGAEFFFFFFFFVHIDIDKINTEVKALLGLLSTWMGDHQRTAYFVGGFLSFFLIIFFTPPSALSSYFTAKGAVWRLKSKFLNSSQIYFDFLYQTLDLYGV